MENNNIHPVFDRMVRREERERRGKHRACVCWFTGLSGSGKSTIAIQVERRLFENGISVQMLDGDNVRSGLNKNLGFSSEDRRENIRRIAEVAKLFLDHGTVVLCSFVSPTEEIRSVAREIIGAEDFLEIFVDTPLEECERRDVKGLYQKARAGQIKHFTGIDAPYEAPKNPFLTIQTKHHTVSESVDAVLDTLLPRIKEERP